MNFGLPNIADVNATPVDASALPESSVLSELTLLPDDGLFSARIREYEQK